MKLQQVSSWSFNDSKKDKSLQTVVTVDLPAIVAALNKVLDLLEKDLAKKDVEVAELSAKAAKGKK